ncbi:solute carrier family 22 member 20-like [Rana temporaria]|uniref:solute carrier family 22 member 20-like n=1 Tax=Rana temporaria TaxID=8407 RepID=UPI001AADD93A|nr:solute carrier family 22 member 20-like [Rana temporaria]
MAFNDILVSIGGVGCFQILHTILLLVPVALLSCHNLLQNFTGAVPDHFCKLPSARVMNSHDETRLFKLYIPLDKNKKLQRCARYQIVEGFLLNATAHQWEEKGTEFCKDGWIYDRSVFSSTIVTEWNLVCNHSSLKQIARSIYMTGVLLGALVFGSLADKVGRMEILTWSYLQMGVAGTCAAFLPTFDAYCAFRFLCGVASSAISVNSISLILEWMPKDGRTLAGNFFGISYSFGQLVLSAMAYKIRDWRLLQFAVSAPFCIFFIYSWWLPESARWLILRDEPEKALNHLRKAANVNGKKKEGEKLTVQILCSEMQKDILIIRASHSVFDLVRTPTMRRMSLSLIIVWFSSNFAYYGLSMDLKDFGLGVFLAQALFGGVEMIAKLIVMLLMTLVGRRVMQFASLFMAGVLVVSYSFMPQDKNLLCTALAVTGKAFLACAITCMYLYTGELYPTEIRQTGMGFSAMNARLGSAVASILHLTGDFSFTILPMMFGIAPIIAGFFSCFLMETKDSHLPDTINEVENRNIDKSSDSEESDCEAFTYKVHLKEIP